jgi:hypothetical protein
MFHRNMVQVFWVVCCVVRWVLLDIPTSPRVKWSKKSGLHLLGLLDP